MNTLQPQIVTVKQCPHCHELKPIDDFYLRGDGRNYNSWCKKCMTEASTRRQKKHDSKAFSTVKSENAVLDQLHRLGIPATPGRIMSHKWADITAWGIVRIEVKRSFPTDNGGYIWHFTRVQMNQGICGEIVILMQDTPQPRFHVLPAQSPVFYRGHDRKSAMVYPLARIWPEAQMVNELMEASLSQWGLIEATRERLCEELRHGQHSFTRRYR